MKRSRQATPAEAALSRAVYEKLTELLNTLRDARMKSSARRPDIVDEQIDRQLEADAQLRSAILNTPASRRRSVLTRTHPRRRTGPWARRTRPPTLAHFAVVTPVYELVSPRKLLSSCFVRWSLTTVRSFTVSTARQNFWLWNASSLPSAPAWKVYSS